jgi:hypothetical protein
MHATEQASDTLFHRLRLLDGRYRATIAPTSPRIPQRVVLSAGRFGTRPVARRRTVREIPANVVSSGLSNAPLCFLRASRSPACSTDRQKCHCCMLASDHPRKIARVFWSLGLEFELKRYLVGLGQGACGPKHFTTAGQCAAKTPATDRLWR